MATTTKPDADTLDVQETPDPTTGRIVLYTLSENDVQRIANDRLNAGPGLAYGNVQHPGDVVPLIVVRPWAGRQINGQAVLDGNDRLWITSAAEGDQPGQWHYPPRV